MATAETVGEPDYDLIASGVRRMYAMMTPEQRSRHSYEAGRTDQKDDLEPIGSENGPQNRI